MCGCEAPEVHQGLRDEPMARHPVRTASIKSRNWSKFIGPPGTPGGGL